MDIERTLRTHCSLIEQAMNGIEIEADEDGLVELTLAVAEGQAGKREIADFFKSKAHPYPACVQSDAYGKLPADTERGE